MIAVPNWTSVPTVGSRMDASSFETELRTDGFGEIVNGEMKPNEVRKVHAHDYEVRGLVLEGGIVLTCGSAERSFGVGEVFTMEAGREHAERASPTGLRFVAGRRRQVA
jgi:quercetin dioxygenase-like cupin family protein